MVPLLPALPPLEFRERWSLALEAPSAWGTSERAAVVGGRAYYAVADRSNATTFAGVDLATGRRLWSVRGPKAYEGEVVANARHVLGLTKDALLEMDPATGRVRWRGRRQGFPGGAALAGDRLVYAPVARTLVGLDLVTRKAAWRKTFPVRLEAGYGHALVDGGTAVFPGDDGSIFGVAVADGRTLWRRPTKEGGNLYLRAMGAATLVVGNGMTALRTRDGAVLWHTPDRPAQDAAYLPRLREIWILALDGRLSRISALTGRTLSVAPLPGVTGDALDGAKPYRGATLLATRGPLLRLDDAGRATAAFDPQETVFDLFPLGRDVVLRTERRLVRLTPGAPPAVGAGAALRAKPALTPAERRAVVATGGRAVGPLLAALPEARGGRREALAELLAGTAGPGDTLRVFALAERMGLYRDDADAATRRLARWTFEKGDREALADAMLPMFRAATTDKERGRYLVLLSRGTHGPVVDETLRLLRDPKTPMEWKGAIYGTIAASGREDVLRTIRGIRGEGRRLKTPTVGLSATKDTDGDGLPDDVDANPFVAPRALSEREKAMAAAFDAFYRYDPMADRPGLVQYGENVNPFELVGWSSLLATFDRAKDLGIDFSERPHGPRRFAFLDFRTHGGAVPTVQGGADGRTATVDLGVLYGGLSNWGVRVTLRKFGDEWYAVDVAQAWFT